MALQQTAGNRAVVSLVVRTPVVQRVPQRGSGWGPLAGIWGSTEWKQLLQTWQDFVKAREAFASAFTSIRPDKLAKKSQIEANKLFERYDDKAITYGESAAVADSLIKATTDLRNAVAEQALRKKKQDEAEAALRQKATAEKAATIAAAETLPAPAATPKASSKLEFESINRRVLEAALEAVRPNRRKAQEMHVEAALDSIKSQYELSSDNIETLREKFSAMLRDRALAESAAAAPVATGRTSVVAEPKIGLLWTDDSAQIYAAYETIGGKKPKGQLGTVCTQGGKPGGHFHHGEQVLVMEHNSHGAPTGGAGQSVTAWTRLRNDGKYEVMGVGYHDTSSRYKAIFFNAIAPHNEVSTVPASPEVRGA